MTATARPDGVAPGLEARLGAGERFFDAVAEPLARLCHAVAERFARGGRLIALGHSPVASSDARHVAVEFVHPVIVGKRALPALALTAQGGSLAPQVELLASEADIVIAFGADHDGGQAAAAIAAARRRGCLTIGFGRSGSEHELQPDTSDPAVAQELVETLYHVLWELVHVFFEHRGLLSGRVPGADHNPGAASFLYPFLGERESRLEPVVVDVRRSVAMKAEEIAGLRTQTLQENDRVLQVAAAELRQRLERGGKLLALGNGGSATDAMDVVADFHAAAEGGGRGWPAVDLTADAGILTAIANDIGPEAIFSRQVIAYGDRDDTLLALSTSGGSVNVLQALAEARHRKLLTIALVGYDGGPVAAQGLADHVILTRSEHIPRIQEAQATAYHVLRELVG